MALLRAGAYALIRYNTSSYSEYGHIELSIYEGLELGCSGVLKVRCQTGGISQRESYAWKYGLESNGCIIEEKEMRSAANICRSVEKGLTNMRNTPEVGQPSCFAEWSLRILTLLKVQKIHVLTRLNEQLVCDIQDLPKYTLRRDYNFLLTTLNTMEADLLSR